MRWTLTILLGLVWSSIVIVNGSLAWRTFVRKEARVPTLLPLVGGFIAYSAAMVCPWDSPLKGLFFWLALILDVGSLPYFVLAIVVVHIADKDYWKKAYMSSWVAKLAVGVLGWLLFLLLIGSVGIPLRQEETPGQVAFWAATIVYWTLYAVVSVRLKSPHRQEDGADGPRPS